MDSKFSYALELVNWIWDQFRMILKKIKKNSKRQAASNKRQAATLYTLTPESG